jgi:hypothetical protein
MTVKDTCPLAKWPGTTNQWNEHTVGGGYQPATWLIKNLILQNASSTAQQEQGWLHLSLKCSTVPTPEVA